MQAHIDVAGSTRRVSSVRRWGLGCLCVLACAVASAGDNPHPTSRFVVDHAELPTVGLRLHRAVDATLQGPEVDRYRVPLRAGQFAAVRIRQLTGNVAVVVFDPAGKLISIVDENGTGQTEVATIVAQASGDYAIQVAVFEWDAPELRYAIELSRLERARTDTAGRARQLLAAWYEATEPGAVVTVLEHGQPVVSAAIGRADVALRIPLTQSTPIDLASVSKQFTGYAIALLVNRGTLRLEDDVRRYLPELPDYGTPITLRHLLEHESGVRDWDGLFGLIGRPIEAGITLDEVLAMLQRQAALNFQPGSRQEYSNSNYVLLAAVIERATGQPFDAWMRNNVLAPLDLRDCQLTRQRQAQHGRVTHSYRASVPTPVVASGEPMVTLGSSALECSARDLTRWLDNYASGRLGGAAVRDRVTDAGAKPTADASRYVYGNWHAQRDGIEVFGHQGLAAGFRTSIYSFPERQLAVIYLANDGNDATYPRARAIEDLFLGIPPAPVTAPDVDYLPSKSEPLAAGKLASYEGRYVSSELPATFVIEADGSGLVLRHPVYGDVQLVPQGPDVFLTANGFLPQIDFRRDERDRVTSLVTRSDDVGSLPFQRVEP